MPHSDMLIEHLKTRRSTPFPLMAEPGPDRASLDAMLAIAARVPDHGKLAPWRFIVIDRAAGARLGAFLGELVCADDPAADAKKLGRTVRQFDEARWKAARFDLVTQGNIAKFSSNPALAAFLLGTGAKVLVEASPRDTIWGIGLGADHAAASDPQRWRGLNLLGFALMAARDALLARA